MGLRDFMKNILFEEEDEEEEYEPEEEVEEEQYIAPRVEVSARSVSPALTPAPAPVQPVQPTQTLTANESSNTTTIFGDLDMDNVSLSDQELSQRPSRNARRRSYLETRRSVSREYEPVLSPIFGNVEEKERQFDQVHNAINLPKPSADFDMVQIISPMYGRQSLSNERQDPRKGKRIAPTETRPKAVEPVQYDEQAFAVISTRNVSPKKSLASDGFEQAARGKSLPKSGRAAREQLIPEPELEPALVEEDYPAVIEEPAAEPEPLMENIEKIDLKTFLSKKPKK